jgi:uridine kinase
MKLFIDGRACFAETSQSLRQIITQIGLDSENFSQRPIAAKISGEVFNLNYIPVREKDITERSSIRRAMAASGGVVELLRYTDPVGREVYERTARFVVFLALHRLWPNVRAKMGTTLGSALYVSVDTEDFSWMRLRKEVAALIEQDIPLTRRLISTLDAVKTFTEMGKTDKARLLSIRKEETFACYGYEDFLDYYYGEMAPSTGYVQVWDILPAEGGFLFIYPDDACPEQVAEYKAMPRVFDVCMEGDRWCELMECETVADLNDLTESGKIRELIRVNEALHEKRYAQVADMVCQRGARAVMLAGPSSSGKTTSANRLATQLRVHGKKPVLMGLDDYYIDRDLIAPGPDGTIDFEHINTIDTALFRQNLSDLLAGKEIEIPTFDFKTGRRVWKGHKFRMEKDTVIIVEGLHALNPMLIPPELDKNSIFKFYICPLIPLSLDDHNRIPASHLRLLRRIVRDIESRGATVERTMSMWDSVRRGEKRWIFPFREQADVIFNTSTLYELAVVKKHIFPLLTAVQPEESCYEQVRGLVKILNYVQEADVDDEIPPTSLLREFIGGNTFYK